MTPVWDLAKAAGAEPWRLLAALRSHGWRIAEDYRVDATPDDARRLLRSEESQDAGADATDDAGASAGASAEADLVRPWNIARGVRGRRLACFLVWKVVKTMHAKRIWGACNRDLGVVSVRSAPTDVGDLLREAVDALVHDEILLVRGGQYTRTSLNPERKAIIERIVRFEFPDDGGAVATWIAGFGEEAGDR